VLSLTLDNNCIIALEDGSGQQEALRRLIALHNQGAIRVFIGLISASENVRDGEPTLDRFMNRLSRLGLESLPRLLPVGRWGMSYWGASVWGGDDGLDKKVQQIIHTSSVDGHGALSGGSSITLDGALDKRQRNTFCDVDGVVAHIRNGNDVFVTEDGRILDRKAALIALGAGDILTPEEALERVTTDAAPSTE
jgi:hypothetical protein